MPQPVRTGLVVAGEASESEEEEIDTTETMPPLMGMLILSQPE